MHHTASVKVGLKETVAAAHPRVSNADEAAVLSSTNLVHFDIGVEDDAVEGSQLPVPMPWTYRHASKEWRAFLNDVKERMSLESRNMAYTAVDAVLQVFRRRLNAQEGL